MPWSRPCVESAALSKIAVVREIFRVLLGLLARDPPGGKAGVEMNYCYEIN